MARSTIHRLGDLQLKIMQVLWDRGPTSVADVHAALADEALAYTTIATMLRKMEDRDLVTHRKDGRRFIYEPRLDAVDVTAGMAGDLVDRVFQGSLTDAVSHLLEAREVDAEELGELELLIRRHRRRKS